ncbi:MAG: hypothetical protein U0Q07_03395 [Acidimicrobiales bacterium]
MPVVLGVVAVVLLLGLWVSSTRQRRRARLLHRAETIARLRPEGPPSGGSWGEAHTFRTGLRGMG